MASSHLGLHEAYQFVRLRRAVISPNFAFLGQLAEFEADLAAGRAKRVANRLPTDWLVPCAGCCLRLRESDICTGVSRAGVPGADRSGQPFDRSLAPWNWLVSRRRQQRFW
ncbi:unnamed protein product [Protopolystoma xenopodis]|uniref:Dual specificity phosphatase catalytic domain-containing protein n=1 Tax=Protopolystoma xenopodis TaxID=117903 RepID=A0A3S5AA13_9PLAT|nr:unnamed protein product [Protopolystoma xenopodis]